MKKMFLSIMISASLASSLIGCGNTVTNQTNAIESQEIKADTNLSGIWRSENNNGNYHEATITENSIIINWVSDDGKTKSLYWAGTYTPPNEYVTEYSWVSNNDHDKTDSAMLASTDDTKEFLFKNGILSYSTSAMGTTTTMELSKYSDEFPSSDEQEQQEMIESNDFNQETNAELKLGGVIFPVPSNWEILSSDETTISLQKWVNQEMIESNDFNQETNAELKLGGVIFPVPSNWEILSSDETTISLQKWVNESDGMMMNIYLRDEYVDISSVENQNTLIQSIGKTWQNYQYANASNIVIAGNKGFSFDFSGIGKESGQQLDGCCAMMFQESKNNGFMILMLQTNERSINYSNDFYKILSNAYISSEDDISYEVTTEAIEETDPTTVEVTEPPIQYYGSGTYKVGEDIPAGEYIVLSNTGDGGYYSVTSDPNGDDILFNDSFEYNGIITISDGEYLHLKRSCIYNLDEWLTQNSIPLDKSGIMLKVGIMLPPGEYKLLADNNDSGYYCIYSDSRQSNIIANDNFEGQSYINVSDGQYLVLNRCKIIQ